MSLCDECPFKRPPPYLIDDLILYGERATWREQDLLLTHSEYRVVTKLASDPTHIQSFRTIYDALKDRPGFAAGRGDEGYRTNVRSSIKRIRIKFRAIDPAFDRIRAMSGVGYGWNT